MTPYATPSTPRYGHPTYHTGAITITPPKPLTIR